MEYKKIGDVFIGDYLYFGAYNKETCQVEIYRYLIDDVRTFVHNGDIYKRVIVGTYKEKKDDYYSTETNVVYSFQFKAGFETDSWTCLNRNKEAGARFTTLQRLLEKSIDTIMTDSQNCRVAGMIFTTHEECFRYLRELSRDQIKELQQSAIKSLEKIQYIRKEFYQICSQKEEEGLKILENQIDSLTINVKKINLVNE